MLSLSLQNRNVDAKEYLDQIYSRYIKLYESSCVVISNIIDKLTPIPESLSLSLTSPFSKGHHYSDDRTFSNDPPFSKDEYYAKKNMKAREQEEGEEEYEYDYDYPAEEFGTHLDLIEEMRANRQETGYTSKNEELKEKDEETKPKDENV
jgi:hypothetical protein